MSFTPLTVGLIILGLVITCWVIALLRRVKASGDEEVLLDIATPPPSDWVVLALCLAAAVGLIVIGAQLQLDAWPGILFPLALALTGALMFVDNLPAAITERGVRRGLSITPWSQFAGWHWDAQQPHTLVLDGPTTGENLDERLAIPVTEPELAGAAPETPDHPSPDDYPDWASFCAVIEAALAKHLPAASSGASSTTSTTPTATPTTAPTATPAVDPPAADPSV